MNGSGKIEQRIDWLLEELVLISQHPDIFIYPHSYHGDGNSLYLEVQPGSGHCSADTAYKFVRHDGMKYDPDSSIFGIGGSPRVSYGPGTSAGLCP